MIDVMQIINNSTDNAISKTQEIDADIEKALALIDVVKKQDAATTVKQLKDLLIEYIIANMKGDLAGAKAIQGQIDKLMETYGKDMQQGNELEAKLKAMQANPSGNPSKDLEYLQSLIAALTKDAGSGDMSNLYQY